METLRAEAYELLSRVPEENLYTLITAMEDLCGPKRRGRHSEEFLELEKLCRPIQNLDEEKELAEWREERFGL